MQQPTRLYRSNNFPYQSISEKVVREQWKNFITRMRNQFGDNANFFTGHSSGRVDKKHYYDDRELFEKVKDFKLWRG